MNGISFYKEEIRDCNAVYFTEEFFNVKNDGSIDVSNELQNAIKTVVVRPVMVFFLYLKVSIC